MTESSTNAMPNQAALDIMAQLNDPEWVKAAARLEEEAGCDVSAGALTDHQLGKMLADPAGFYQHQRLRTLVFRELRQLLSECELGIGLQSAQATGKKILIERLQAPPADIQAKLLSIVSEDLSTPEDVSLSEEAKVLLRQIIQTVLRTEDWETISGAAVSALQHNFRARFDLPQTALIV